jgi:transcriptional regulator with XRE-family HTH domain
MNTTLSSFNLAIGQKIRQKRLELNWTQSKLANKIGVTFQQVQKYEKGTNGCSAYRIQELADHLKVNVMYFFEYSKKDMTEVAKELYANDPSISFEMRNGQLVIKGNPFDEDNND